MSLNEPVFGQCVSVLSCIMYVDNCWPSCDVCFSAYSILPTTSKRVFFPFLKQLCLLLHKLIQILFQIHLKSRKFKATWRGRLSEWDRQLPWSVSPLGVIPQLQLSGTKTTRESTIATLLQELCFVQIGISANLTSYYLSSSNI